MRIASGSRGFSLLWLTLALVGLAAAFPATLMADEPAPADRKLVVANHALNRFVRNLDGQWQGLCVASDGNVYVAGGSHSPNIGAPFFRYNPATKELKMLVRDITFVCGEDPAKTPPQGKIHSDILEYKGWLYFGTHLADYSAEGVAAYTGGHLIGYELATEKFRDLGVIHPNYPNYSAIGLDAERGKIFFWATPFGKGDGAHVYRIDIASGAKQDFGLAAPSVKGASHGPACPDFFVDGRGDCWFAYYDTPVVNVARAATGRIERFPNAMPPGTTEHNFWYRTKALDENRALVAMQNGLWIFDSRKVGGKDCPFTLWRAAPMKYNISYLALDAERVYWMVMEDGGGVRIWSSNLKDPSDANTIDHGLVTDMEGRTPYFLGDIASAGHGLLYMVGRWRVRAADMDTIGIIRNRSRMAVMFSVADVSADLRPQRRADEAPSMDIPAGGAAHAASGR